jgi:hypothetical protein
MYPQDAALAGRFVKRTLVRGPVRVRVRDVDGPDGTWPVPGEDLVKSPHVVVATGTMDLPDVSPMSGEVSQNRT